MSPSFSQLERKHSKGSSKGKLLIGGEVEPKVRIQGCPAKDGEKTAEVSGP